MHVYYSMYCMCIICDYIIICLADETSYSEDDGWEFITLADQVSSVKHVVDM